MPAAISRFATFTGRAAAVLAVLEAGVALVAALYWAISFVPAAFFTAFDASDGQPMRWSQFYLTIGAWWLAAILVRLAVVMWDATFLPSGDRRARRAGWTRIALVVAVHAIGCVYWVATGELLLFALAVILPIVLAAAIFAAARSLSRTS